MINDKWLPASSFVLKFNTDLIPTTPKFLSCSILGWAAAINVSVIGKNFAGGSFGTINKN